MSPRREFFTFGLVLAALVGIFFHESLFGGKVLSPSDVLLVQSSFRERGGPLYEPENRLLMDPVLQFQPWLEFNRKMLRSGRLPLWNDFVGCGAPHLANGQSAVFDPFHLLPYLGKLPSAYAWMAAGRLLTAGLGMFLLARCWELGCWGRWFAGLSYPFCGFLVLWLLYPVTNVAIWMPWLFWATERALRTPGARSLGVVAATVGLVLVGGHVQTSAHVLLAAGLYVLWRASMTHVFGGGRGSVRASLDSTVSLRAVGSSRATRSHAESDHTRCPSDSKTRHQDKAGSDGASPSPLEHDAVISRSSLACWAGGVLLGIALAAVEVVPLGFYLAKSPVWADRARERTPWWTIAKPRWLNAVCTAWPYVYGSQRRGHPNLARALGVHNVNEAAGGFVGLATLIWLAPVGWRARKRQPRLVFLTGLLVVGASGAFGLPPVDNLLRALPVLNVTDNRRMTLWVAFALILLGAFGIESLTTEPSARPGRIGPRLWLALAAVMAILALNVPRAEAHLRSRALEHYAQASTRSPSTDSEAFRLRAERQVRATLSFVPRYLGMASAQLVALAALSLSARRTWLSANALRGSLLALTLLNLFTFGVGVNPAIARDGYCPTSPVIEHLRREIGTRGRILAIGEELAPNTLMRYGLADPRNYDSVELARSLDWFAPLYEPSNQARTSRREITWAGVLRTRDRLEESGVAAVIAASPPPPNAFERVEHIGTVWIAYLNAKPLVSSATNAVRLEALHDHGMLTIVADAKEGSRILIRQTYDPGWRAQIDGEPVRVEPYKEVFLTIPVKKGMHSITLRYDPPEVRSALAASFFAALLLVFALTRFPLFRFTRIIAQGLGSPRAVALQSNR